MTSTPTVRAIRRLRGNGTVVRCTVLFVMIVVAVVCFAFVSRFFLTTDNVVNLISDIAVSGVVAVPATLLIMTGTVDLSVGATAGFTGILLAAVAPDFGIASAVLIAVSVALVVGVGNGVLITVLGMDSVLVTFAVMALMRGLSYLIPSGLAVVVPGFRWLGHGMVIGVPVPMILFVGIGALGLATARAQWCLRLRELGGTPAARRRSEWRKRWPIIVLLVITSAAAALSGLIRASQLGTGVPTSATGLEVVIAAAVLLGGGRLSGGGGSVVGTILALVIISVVDNGLSLSNVTPYATQVFHAALLVLALFIGRPGRRRPDSPSQ